MRWLLLILALLSLPGWADEPARLDPGGSALVATGRGWGGPKPLELRLSLTRPVPYLGSSALWWPTAVLWVLLIVSLAIAFSAWQRDPAQRKARVVGVAVLRLAMGLMWWMQSLWKIYRAPYTSFRHPKHIWLGRPDTVRLDLRRPKEWSSLAEDWGKAGSSQ